MAEQAVNRAGDLSDEFWSYLQSVQDENGFWPLPGMSRLLDGTLEVAAIVPVEAAYRYYRQLVSGGQHSEVIVGVDRTTAPNQGTEFADVLTVAYWRRLPDGGEEQKIGVVNYSWEPKILRPIDWGNAYWDRQFRRELACMVNAKVAVPKKR